MKLLKTVLSILLGLPLVIFGLNGFLQFMPMPAMGPEAMAFMGAIASTKFFFPIIGLVEVVAGLLLVVRKAVPLALILVFPIILCATLFHLGLDMGGIGLALICLILNAILMFLHKESYKSLLH